MKKRIISIILTMAMAFGLLAVASITASAAGEIGIQTPPPAFVLGTTSDTPTLVGFGGKQWAVIGYDGTGAATTSGKLTLLLATDQSYGKTKFYPNIFDTNGNEYSGSILKSYLEEKYSELPAKEQALVAGRDLPGGGRYKDADKMRGSAVDGAKFWPLSASEAVALHSDEVRKFFFEWWLRTPGEDKCNVAAVYASGYYRDDGLSVPVERGVRPALWLDLAKVRFISDASGATAKSAAAADGSLKPMQAVGRAVKFTFTDSSLTLGSLTPTSRSGRTVNFTYSGATAGKTLSAVVLRSGAVKYYGKLVASTTASGSATVILPADFAETDTVQIFVEEANGDNQSDFASAYKQLSVTTTNSFVLTSGSVNRTSDTAATIGFRAPADGTVYYYVTYSGDSVPTATYVKANGASLGAITAGTISGKAVTLTAGAKDIFLVEEAFGLLSQTPLKIPVAAYSLTPTYTAAITPTSKTFVAATVGYDEQEAQTFTITNTGSGTITGLSALLSGSDFEFSPGLSATSIAPGGTATASVRPKIGLAAGAHASTLTVTANNGISLSAALSFTVNPSGGGGGSDPDPAKKYIRLWGKTTTYEDTFLNWLLVILCFGSIWMAF